MGNHGFQGKQHKAIAGMHSRSRHPRGTAKRTEPGIPDRWQDCEPGGEIIGPWSLAIFAADPE